MSDTPEAFVRSPFAVHPSARASSARIGFTEPDAVLRSGHMKPFLALLLALNCCAAEIKIFFSPHGGCTDAVVQQLSGNGQTRGDQTHDETLNAVEQLWNGKLKRD